MAKLINRIRIRNFKSIKSCEVALNDLCMLVGVNGAGKSNFLDSFDFVADACKSTLDTAIRNRGGMSAVRRKSNGHPTNFGMSFFVNLPDKRNAFFAFEISALPGERFEVRKERAVISDEDPSKKFEYLVERGQVKRFSESSTMPDVRPDRFFLTSASGIRPFDLLFDALSGISVFDINPDHFKLPQPHESGDQLLSSGENLASVLRRLEESDERTYERVCEYLRKVVTGITNVETKSLGPTETIQFSQYIQGSPQPWKFDALNMSNGTLRSLGVLLALFHRPRNNTSPIPFIGVEEPEGTIHPGAAAVLMDAIIEASKDRQVILTTHSPELLDHHRIDENSLYVVASEKNETRIGLADEASRKAIQSKLLTPGELLRTSQLTAQTETSITMKQSDLFSK